MTFVYSVDFQEGYAQGYGKFSGPSKEHGSTRRSQFQCIGWILECVDRVTEYSRDSSIEIYGDRYDIEGLVEVGKLSHDVACLLSRADSWEERFNIVWFALDERQKKIALKMNYSRSENFWPYFDAVNKGAGAESICDRYREALREATECEVEQEIAYYAVIKSEKDISFVRNLGAARHNKDFYHCFGNVNNSASS